MHRLAILCVVSDVGFWPWLCSYKIFITARSYATYDFFCRSSEPSVSEETILERCMIMCWRSKRFDCDLLYCALLEWLKLICTDQSCCDHISSPGRTIVGKSGGGVPTSSSMTGSIRRRSLKVKHCVLWRERMHCFLYFTFSWFFRTVRGSYLVVYLAQASLVLRPSPLRRLVLRPSSSEARS